MASIDQQFIEYIVKELVGHPEDVTVERRIDEKGVLLELTVNPEDLGRVIGKRGVTAQSLRTLLRALGTKNDARYNLKIINNDQPSDDSAPRQSQAQSDDDSTNLGEDSTVVDNTTDEAVENEPEKESDLTKNTRKELADLDDLDV
jgi:uncharacterized protein